MALIGFGLYPIEGRPPWTTTILEATVERSPRRRRLRSFGSAGGLVWTYAYNHEEAVTYFQRAVEADTDCAMAYWGIAYDIGPNYNKQWADFEDDEKPDALTQALGAIEQAKRCADQATSAERALIEDFGPWNDAYAEGANTVEAITVLENAFDNLDGAWQHPGLLHMYIHLMEMSPHPKRALRQGDRLSTLVPEAGHLLHMATLIDVLCGDYQNVVSRNHAATTAGRKFLKLAGAENFYSLYRCHNYHFKIYGAVFLGQPGPALEAADELVANLPETILRPMADWLEAFIPMKQHVLIRLGRWHDILARDRVPESRMLLNNTCHDILQIARTCCWAKWPITRATTRPLSSVSADLLNLMTTCPMTSLGGGCSRPVTPWGHFCWNKDTLRKRRPFIERTLAWTPH